MFEWTYSKTEDILEVSLEGFQGVFELWDFMILKGHEVGVRIYIFSISVKDLLLEMLHKTGLYGNPVINLTNNRCLDALLLRFFDYINAIWLNQYEGSLCFIFFPKI